MHEVLYSRDLDLAVAYKNEFAGMEREPVSLVELQATRERLRSELFASPSPVTRLVFNKPWRGRTSKLVIPEALRPRDPRKKYRSRG